MAEAALTFLLENVQKLIVDRMDLISGAEKEMKSLKNEVELMIAVLRDLEENQEKGEVFLQLEKQIREAVYDAEDTLDACLSEKSFQKVNYLSFTAVDLAKKVKQVREDVLQPIFNEAKNTFLALRPMLYNSGARQELQRCRLGVDCIQQAGKLDNHTCLHALIFKACFIFNHIYLDREHSRPTKVNVIQHPCTPGDDKYVAWAPIKAHHNTGVPSKEAGIQQ